MKILSKYETYQPKKGKHFSEPSRAIQSMRDGTFIESYLRKYRITGVLGDPSRLQKARYGDFASLPDFTEAQNRIAYTIEYFEALPSSVRKKFNNDVRAFVGYVSDPANTAEAIKLGILRSTGGFDEVQKENVVPPSADDSPSSAVKSEE